MQSDYHKKPKAGNEKKKYKKIKDFIDFVLCICYNYPIIGREYLSKYHEACGKKQWVIVLT